MWLLLVPGQTIRGNPPKCKYLSYHLSSFSCYIDSINCPFLYCCILSHDFLLHTRSDLSGLFLPARKRQSHAALKQSVTSKTIWSCVQTWPRALLLPSPSSLVGYFKPQLASKPQTTSHSGAAAVSGDPQRPRSRGALLATRPEVGGRAWDEAGLRFGWGLEWSLIGLGPSGCATTTSVLLLSSP